MEIKQHDVGTLKLISTSFALNIFSTALNIVKHIFLLIVGCERNNSGFFIKYERFEILHSLKPVKALRYS